MGQKEGMEREEVTACTTVKMLFRQGKSLHLPGQCGREGKSVMHSPQIHT